MILDTIRCHAQHIYLGRGEVAREGITAWEIGCLRPGHSFFLDQLFGTIVFECELLSRPLLFQGGLYRTDVHNHCSGVGWTSVFQVGE